MERPARPIGSVAAFRRSVGGRREHRLKAELRTRLRRTEITATDRAIDGLVSELYGLTEKEIAIVEAGLQAMTNGE